MDSQVSTAVCTHHAAVLQEQQHIPETNTSVLDRSTTISTRLQATASLTAAHPKDNIFEASFVRHFLFQKLERRRQNKNTDKS